MQRIVEEGGRHWFNRISEVFQAFVVVLGELSNALFGDIECFICLFRWSLLAWIFATVDEPEAVSVVMTSNA